MFFFTISALIIIWTWVYRMKNGPVLFILSNFPNDRKINQLPSTRLQPYVRVVLGSNRVDLNQPESGVFTHKLQFESTRVISCVRMGCMLW